VAVAPDDVDWATGVRECCDRDRPSRRGRRVRAAFERHEQALVSNDVATLGEMFRNDPRTIRCGATAPGKVGRMT
jgi:hypothetical protein